MDKEQKHHKTKQSETINAMVTNVIELDVSDFWESQLSRNF